MHAWHICVEKHIKVLIFTQLYEFKESLSQFLHACWVSSRLPILASYYWLLLHSNSMSIHPSIPSKVQTMEIVVAHPRSMNWSNHAFIHVTGAHTSPVRLCPNMASCFLPFNIVHVALLARALFPFRAGYCVVRTSRTVLLCSGNR